MSTIDSFFQHKEMKNAQAQQDAFDNADSMMTSVASGRLKPRGPAIRDALLRLQHYDPERAALYAAELKNIRQGNRQGGLVSARKVAKRMRENRGMTQTEAIRGLPLLGQMQLQQLEHQGKYLIEQSPEEIKAARVDRDRQAILAGLAGADHMLKIRTLDAMGLLPEGGLAEIQAVSEDLKVKRAIEEADKALRREAQAEDTRKAVDGYIRRRWVFQGGPQSLRQTTLKQLRELEKFGINEVYVDRMGAFTDRQKEIEKWPSFYEEIPGTGPPPEPLERPTKQGIREQLYPDSIERLRVELETLKEHARTFQGSISGAPGQETKTGLGDQAHAQARLMVNSITQNLPDWAAKTVVDGLAQAIKDGEVDAFLQELQREFPQAFQPGG
jgi:hypothetical protein